MLCPGLHLPTRSPPAAGVAACNAASAAIPSPVGSNVRRRFPRSGIAIHPSVSRISRSPAGAGKPGGVRQPILLGSSSQRSHAACAETVISAKTSETTPHARLPTAREHNPRRKAADAQPTVKPIPLRIPCCGARSLLFLNLKDSLVPPPVRRQDRYTLSRGFQPSCIGRSPQRHPFSWFKNKRVLSGPAAYRHAARSRCQDRPAGLPASRL